MFELFPFSEYWWFYLGFVGLVVLLLAVDLGIFHRKAHAVSFREAATWTVVWIALSLLFNFLLYRYALWKFPQDSRLMALPGFDPSAAAWSVSLEFLTGYVIEKSLSVSSTQTLLHTAKRRIRNGPRPRPTSMHLRLSSAPET